MIRIPDSRSLKLALMILPNIFATLLLLSALPYTVYADSPAPPAGKPAKAVKEDPEVKMGREASDAINKQVKLITSGPIFDRVNRIGQAIATAANEGPVPALFGSNVYKKFHYTFHVIDSPDVNAFSLPGGFVYVNTGLVKFVHSDDELAAVLSHELGHVLHHHALTLEHQQSKIQNILTPLEIAAVGLMLSGHTSQSDAGTSLLMSSQLYSVARMNGYSVHAEEDADHTAIFLMMRTKYNPAALYTFMLRLANYEASHGPSMLGIYRDHPPTPQRVATAKALLEKLNIPIYLSQIDPSWRAEVVEVHLGLVDLARVTVRQIPVFEVVGEEGQTALERGKALADTLDYLLDRHLEPYQIRYSPDRGYVMALGKPFQNQADATAQGRTLEELSHSFSDAVLQIDQLKQIEMSDSSFLSTQ